MFSDTSKDCSVISLSNEANTVRHYPSQQPESRSGTLVLSLAVLVGMLATTATSRAQEVLSQELPPPRDAWTWAEEPEPFLEDQPISPTSRATSSWPAHMVPRQEGRNEGESASTTTLEVDLDDYESNPLQHHGPWLRTRQGYLPVFEVTGRGENGSSVADTYDDLIGIEVLSAGGDATPFSLNIGGRLQLRYGYLRDQSVFENPTLNQFDVARGRLGFRGHIFDSYVRYNIGTDWSPSNARLVNGFAEVDLQEGLGIGFGSSTRLRFGYWRTNFGRQAAESSQNLQFVDRSLASNVFNLGNNTGIGLLGGFTHWYRPVRYELALVNGFGTFGATDRDQLDRNLGVALRVTEELMGDYSSGESDNDLSPLAAIRVGASAAYTRRSRRGVGGSTGEFDNSPAFLLVDDPANGDAFFAMDQLRGAETDYDLLLGGLEADIKHAGWSLHAEYLCRWIDNVRFNTTHQFHDFTHGFYVQSGYFLTEKTELAARHSTIWANGFGDGSPINRDYRTTSNESGVGLNFYFRRHLSKLQFEAMYYDGVPINANSMNLLAGDRGLLFRAQYQVSF
ncbi:MAG: porin [Pirellulaceae bacterium]